MAGISRCEHAGVAGAYQRVQGVHGSGQRPAVINAKAGRNRHTRSEGRDRLQVLAHIILQRFVIAALRIELRVLVLELHREIIGDVPQETEAYHGFLFLLLRPVVQRRVLQPAVHVAVKNRQSSRKTITERPAYNETVILLFRIGLIERLY